VSDKAGARNKQVPGVRAFRVQQEVNRYKDKPEYTGASYGQETSSGRVEDELTISLMLPGV
jgi:hypothetical protein